MKSYTNKTKHFVVSNCIYNKEVKENSLFTQLKHNSDEGILNNYSDSNELTVKNSSTLSLSKKKTKSIKKKSTDNCKNKFKKSSNIKLSIISGSESSSSEDIEFPIKDLGDETYFSKENENDTSNSDDEMHSKFKQNVFKRQNINNFKIYYSTDETDSSYKLSTNIINVNPNNISETDNCNKSFGNNLLLDKKPLKKYNKRKKANNNSTCSQLSNKIINKTDINNILEKDSSCGDEIVLIKEISNEKQASEKVFKKKPLGSTNITNSSSDDELFIPNLIKSKKKMFSSKQNDINLLVNKENKKHKLINEILTLIKYKNKRPKQTLKLHVPQTTSNALENRNKLFKSNKITKVEPIVKTKSKKSVLHLKIPIEDSKISMPIYNVSQKLNCSKLSIKPSDASIYNEKHVIKKVIKKQKLSKTKKVDAVEQTTKIDIPTELKKTRKYKEKLYKKSKYQKASMLNGLKNDVLIKKREIPRETKDFLIDSIIGALEDSSSDHSSIKKKNL